MILFELHMLKKSVISSFTMNICKARLILAK
jgi:hypothetical protein